MTLVTNLIRRHGAKQKNSPNIEPVRMKRYEQWGDATTVYGVEDADDGAVRLRTAVSDGWAWVGRSGFC
jgi:hypothetical protein